jgi:hypothetical protein
MIVRLMFAISLLLTITSMAAAKKLKPETAAVFDHYAGLAEQRMSTEMSAGRFLWMDGLPPEQRDPVYARLRKGEVVTHRLETLDQGHAIDVPDGLIHHWVGAVFIPGATMAKTIALLQDYDNQYKYYAPDVERSKLLSRSGDEFKIYLRLRRKKVVTVVLNTEYDVRYRLLGENRASARSTSTRIAQVQNAGQHDESEKPVGDDDGFMWRLNSYWRFWQRDGGTYVQLEAISLTRDIPAGLGWLVRPFITSVPEESLAFTLSRTRQALCCGK